MPNRYIGTKLVKGSPMTRQEYVTYRGWELPANENGADEGYLVEYLDGVRPNDSRHDGYISWSPKDVFEAAYESTSSGMSFGHAMVALEAGDRVMRSGWNGKGMWLLLVNGAGADVESVDYIIRDDSDEEPTHLLKLLPWIGMKTADNGFVPWLASQTDMLAKDWMVIRTEDNMAVDNPWDAELRNVSVSGPILDVINHDVYLHGLIYGDRQQRHPDGQFVNTSKVTHWDEATQIATTSTGTRYKLVNFAEVKG